MVGGICILLALYAMQILPVNIAGLFWWFWRWRYLFWKRNLQNYGVLARLGGCSHAAGALMLIRSALTSAGVSLTVALAVTFAIRGADDFSDATR